MAVRKRLTRYLTVKQVSEVASHQDLIKTLKTGAYAEFLFAVEYLIFIGGVTMKLFVVKYLFRGQKYSVRILAETQGKATNTAIDMTRGHIYSVTEVI